MWGIYVTKWLDTQSLLLFLALHKVGFFRISLFIPNGICLNKAQRTWKIKLKSSSFLCKCYSAIWSNSLLKNVFAANLGYRDNEHEFWRKTFSECSQESDQIAEKRLYYQKELDFLCALFEQIPSGINRDILKNPTWCGAKNSNKFRALSHLVMWILHTDSGIIFSSAP